MNQSTVLPAHLIDENESSEEPSMSFSVVPMLVAGQSISSEAREALRENRLEEAAELLIQQYGLTCTEASDLLDVSVC